MSSIITDEEKLAIIETNLIYKWDDVDFLFHFFLIIKNPMQGFVSLTTYKMVWKRN